MSYVIMSLKKQKEAKWCRHVENQSRIGIHGRKTLQKVQKHDKIVFEETLHKRDDTPTDN